MHHIELLGTDNKNFRIKFISILKDISILDTKTLSSFYDSLIFFNTVVIEFKELDTPYLNDITEQLVELEIRIGRTSFHEEDGYLFGK